MRYRISSMKTESTMYEGVGILQSIQYMKETK